MGCSVIRPTSDGIQDLLGMVLGPVVWFAKFVKLFGEFQYVYAIRESTIVSRCIRVVIEPTLFTRKLHGCDFSLRHKIFTAGPRRLAFPHSLSNTERSQKVLMPLAVCFWVYPHYCSSFVFCQFDLPHQQWGNQSPLDENQNQLVCA